MTVSAATISIASMGTVNHDVSIQSYSFTPGQNVVNDARTHFVAANGITNSKPIVTELYGGDSVANDSGSINVSTGGNIVTDSSIKTVVRRFV